MIKEPRPEEEIYKEDLSKSVEEIIQHIKMLRFEGQNVILADDDADELVKYFDDVSNAKDYFKKD